MKILDVLTAPWAIQPAKLQEIQAIYATHLRGDKIDVGAVEARLGRPLANEQRRYEVIDGVAVLPIVGVIAKRANLFMEISGGVSTELVARDLRDAIADTSVHSIILSIDSPGGQVDGTATLANLVREARAQKPVVTLAGGVMASAAYWIGSAAEKAYIAESTTVVGSIGVVSTHVDVSGSEAQRGIKTTEIYAGAYKRIASQYAPLSDAGRTSMQDQVDYFYSVFVGAVAANRGVSEEKVVKDMADGRVFIGQQAIDAGLVDGVSTLEALIAQLNQDRASGQSSTGAGAAQNPPTSLQGTNMTPQEFAAAHPEAVTAFRAEGAAAERTRIQAVEGQLIPGHEALINTLKFDGTSNAGDAAIAVNAAEKTLRTTQAAASANDAPKPLAQKPAATVEAEGSGPAADAPIEDRAKAAWDKDATLRAEFADSFATYLAYAKAEDKGQVRVLASKK